MTTILQPPGLNGLTQARAKALNTALVGALVRVRTPFSHANQPENDGWFEGTFLGIAWGDERPSFSLLNDGDVLLTLGPGVYRVVDSRHLQLEVIDLDRAHCAACLQWDSSRLLGIDPFDGRLSHRRDCLSR